MSMAAPLATHLGTPTPLDRLGGGRWWKAARHLLDGASPLAALSPASGRSMLDGRAVHDDALIARQGGVKYVVGADGALTAVPADTLAYDWSSDARELLLEGQATNLVRNSVGSGAGVGQPGAYPTYWNQYNGEGLTREIVRTGSLKGVPYTDIRMRGTASGNGFILYFENTSACPAVAGDPMAWSLYLSLVDGSLANVTQIFLAISERDGSGQPIIASAGTNLLNALSTDMERFSTTYRMGNASAAYAHPRLQLHFPSGSVLDFTLRVGYPQLEKAAAPSSIIPTSGATVTRPADVAPLWSGAGAATAWAWRGHVPATFSGQMLLGATGGSYLESGFSDPTSTRVSGHSDSPWGDTGILPGFVGLSGGWGASGRRACNAGRAPAADSFTATRSRMAMGIGPLSGLAAGQILRLRELVAWRLPDRPSAAGCQSQARPWSA